MPTPNDAQDRRNLANKQASLDAERIEIDEAPNADGAQGEDSMPLLSRESPITMDGHAEGSFAIDALLEIMPGSDGEPTGLDALNHRLAELSSVWTSSSAEIV